MIGKWSGWSRIGQVLLMLAVRHLQCGVAWYSVLLGFFFPEPLPSDGHHIGVLISDTSAVHSDVKWLFNQTFSSSELLASTAIYS